MTKITKELQESMYDPGTVYGKNYPRYKTVPIAVDYDKNGKKRYYTFFRFEKRRISLAVVKELMKEDRAVFHNLDESPAMGELYADPAPSTYGKVEHGDMLLKDGLLVQKTFSSESTGLKPGYPMNAPTIGGPADVAQSVEYMEFYDREFGTVLHLDTKNRIVGKEIVSIGSLNAAVIHPREVFKHAVLSNSASIIFVHNHPSGDPTPSREDEAITKKLAETGYILGITLLDSMVIGRGGKYYSFRESGKLPSFDRAGTLGIPKALDPAPKEQIDTSKAEALGRAAHKTGLLNVPAHDPALWELTKGRKVGDKRTIPELKAWIRGWTKEHIAEIEREFDPTKKKYVVHWGQGERKTWDKLSDAAKQVKELIRLGNTDAYFTHDDGSLLDPAPKRCEPSINVALERKGIEPDTVDVAALIDSQLSCDENRKMILKQVGASKTDKYADAVRKTAQYYQGTGKLARASPQERAAAFAAMREAGTLRGYDPIHAHRFKTDKSRKAAITKAEKKEAIKRAAIAPIATLYHEGKITYQEMERRIKEAVSKL